MVKRQAGARKTGVGNIWGRARRYASGLAAFVALTLAVKACADLSTAPGVGLVNIEFADTVTFPRINNTINLVVGDTVAPAFAVSINGLEQENARYVFKALSDTQPPPADTVLSVIDNGNRVVVRRPGPDGIIATLVG